MITKTFILTIATDTEEEMQKEKEHLSMIYGAEEQKSGRWIDVRMGRYVWLHRCSNCLQNSVMESKYCPCCGAKMEVEDDR